MLTHIHNNGSQEHEASPLYIIRLAIDHNPGNYGSSWGLEFYRWIYCVKGSGKLSVNDETVSLEEGYGYLLYPDIPYKFHSDSEDWQLDILDFDGKIVAELLKTLNMNESQAFHFLNTDFFHQKMLDIYGGYKSGEIKESAFYSTACYDLLIRIGNHVVHFNGREIEKNPLEYNDPVMRIIGYLELHYNEPVTLDQIAEHVGLTKQYICALFKQTLHRTIITELNYIRIAHARKILKQYPQKRLDEVAKMCGYDNAVYFGKVFKKVNGNTPDQYRKML